MITIQEFLSLRDQFPVLDVRSEGEFAAGHIRAARNVPLLNDAERIAVGTDYKKKGQSEAIKTGFRLVGPRLAHMMEEAGRLGDELLVYCWRGGMRSSNFCQFAAMAKIKTHQVAGGYKSYRRLAAMSFINPVQLIVLGGCTGSGKSEILRALAKQGEQIIDLEQIASHRGSAFGALMQAPQPTTEQFQNDLFEEIRRLDPLKRIWIEDESLTIGKVALPTDLWAQMSASPVIEICVEKDTRVKRLSNEYGEADQEEFLQAMTRITKKLGGQHFLAAKEKLLKGDMYATIDILLTYYDKAYRIGLEKKGSRIKLKTAWDGLQVEHYVSQLLVDLDTQPSLV